MSVARTITLAGCVFSTVSTHAAHPFVTDDTGTQGSNNNQIELNTDWSRQANGNSHVAALTYTRGTLETLDVFINAPRKFSSPSGINDVSLGAKWRFWENGKTRFALKPELLIPTGDENRNLGNGRTGMTLSLLGSHDAAPWTFNANFSVTENHYRLAATDASSRSTIWRVSTATTYTLNERWRWVADTGIARNQDRASNVNPAFILTGMIYSPHKDIDFDLGVKFGINRAEVDRQIGVGVTVRF